MPTPEIIVRPPETDAETDALFATSVAMFGSSLGGQEAVREWRAYAESLPDGYPGMLRGAFEGGTYLGGYIHYEREVRIGSARVLTGCIGDVAVRAEHQRRGVASALLRAALDHARARGQALLMLDGIPGFYHRFGFTDVLDITRHLIARAAVRSLPPVDVTVRPAAVADAPDLLGLYERHYGGYVGSFRRTLDRQRHLVAARLPKNPPLLAVDPAGRAAGYLLMPWSAQRQYAAEVAADTWPAAVALLRYHAALLGDALEAPSDLIWPLPPDSPTFFLIAEHLALTSRTHHHPYEGWMARPANAAALMRAIEPELQARWSSAPPASAALALQVEESRFTVVLGPQTLAVSAGAEPGAIPVRLTPQAFTQLVFGYRPAAWVAALPGVAAPREALPLLAALFPTRTGWVPGSDAF